MTTVVAVGDRVPRIKLWELGGLSGAGVSAHDHDWMRLQRGDYLAAMFAYR